MEKTIKHKITSSEIAWGIINVTERDGMKEFFNRYGNKRFNVIIKGKTLNQRAINQSKRIWIGWNVLSIFQPGDILKIMNNGADVVID